jgi:hypothetical protein
VGGGCDEGPSEYDGGGADEAAIVGSRKVSVLGLEASLFFV